MGKLKMRGNKSGSLGSGTSVASKVIAGIKKMQSNPVVNLAEYRTGRANAEAIKQRIASKKEMGALDPIHAVYAYVQNVCASIIEQLLSLRELQTFGDVIDKAHDEYMPSAPPMSPLTGSYFTCWASFDFAIKGETLGTILLAVAQSLGMDAELLRLIQVLQDSRMGLYVHQGLDGGKPRLCDLVTGTEVTCVVPAGYPGKRGEIWYVRVLPPPWPELSDSLVFTTPYVVLDSGEASWESYFDRVLGHVLDRRGSYEKHMKFGKDRHYWNEYVFEGYSNHRPEVIFLEGLPDVPSSRPHNPEFRE